MSTTIITNGDFSIHYFPRAGGQTLLESLPLGWNFTNQVFGQELYLIRHPLEWCLSRYNQTNKIHDFKQFLLNNRPETIPIDAEVLRLEYLVQDIDDKINIKVKKLRLNKGEKHIIPCLTSKVLVRQYYSTFYKLGDYD